MPKFDFGKVEFQKTLKAFGWSVGSATIVLLLNLLPGVQFSPEVAFLGPLINTILVMCYQFVKDNTE